MKISELTDILVDVITILGNYFCDREMCTDCPMNSDECALIELIKVHLLLREIDKGEIKID